MAVPARELYLWHARPGAFGRLAPPWQNLRIASLEQAPEGPATIGDDAKLTIMLKLGPIELPWVAHHHDHADLGEGGGKFSDTQLKGPFAAWDHTHSFDSQGSNKCVLTDDIHYRLKGGAIGKLLGSKPAAASLDRLFTFRHERTRRDLERHARFADAKPKTIAITGASGMLGSALVPYLQTAGHTVRVLIRPGGTKPPASSQLETRAWDPDSGTIEAGALDGVDTVIHLAAHNVARKKWDTRERERILESRVKGTSLIARAASEAPHKPVLLCASAIGYYGNRGDETVTEDSQAGKGFLSDVCVEWERCLAPAIESGARVVVPRIGVVLGAKGGMLEKLLPVFSMGLGGPMGPGNQWVPWIGLDELTGLFEAMLHDDSFEGVYNAVAPEPITNAGFAKVLGSVLRRPAVLPVPTFALKAAFGEMANETILKSIRGEPKRLHDRGYRFDWPTLDACLRWELGRPPFAVSPTLDA